MAHSGCRQRASCHESAARRCIYGRREMMPFAALRVSLYRAQKRSSRTARAFVPPFPFLHGPDAEPIRGGEALENTVTLASFPTAGDCPGGGRLFSGRKRIAQIGMYHRVIPAPAGPPSTNHVSECSESIEHVRVWTITFPHQAVGITLQIERAVPDRCISGNSSLRCQTLQRIRVRAYRCRAPRFSTGPVEDRPLRRGWRVSLRNDRRRFASGPPLFLTS